MRRILLALILTLSYSFSFAQWQKVNDIDSFPRSRGITFVIGDTAYLGNGDAGFFQYTQDFRGYTQQGNTWTEEPRYPGGGGDLGFRFVINGTAYIGDGANPGWQNDCWAYSPSTGWVKKTTPPGGIRGYSSGFTIGNKGYFGTGFYGNTAYNDFYEYDPTTGAGGTWTAKASLPITGGRGGDVGFSFNGKGYIGLGGDGTGKAYKDMYRYDPVADKWDTMAPMPATTGMEEPAYFVICGKLFVTCGDSIQSGQHTSRQSWMFNPSNGPKGSWTRIDDFPGPLPAYSPSGWSMGDTGFVYGGYDYVNNNYYRSDMYRYIPTPDVLALALTTSTPDTSICSGSPVKLSVSGAMANSWSTGDTASSIIVSPTSNATYIVKSSEGVCFGIDTFNITVVTGSALSIAPANPEVCSGQPVTLTVSGGSGSTLTWSPPTGLNIATGDTVIASPANTTTYTVSTGNGACSSNNTVVVTVGNTAVGGTVSAVRDTLCAGTPGNLLLSNSSGKDIQWQSSLDDATFINANDTLTTYKTAPLLQTTWYRALLGSGNCSAVSDTFQLYVPPALTAYFYFTESEARQLTFNSDSSSGNIRSYHWDFGDGHTSTEKNPQHTYTNDSTYYICLTLYDGSNCSYTFCRYSEVSVGAGVPGLSAAGNWMVYPNPFSDQLTISGKQTDSRINSIELYDVLGRMVLNKTCEVQANTIPINLSGLSQGMYYLEIKTGSANFFQPIIKQR